VGYFYLTKKQNTMELKQDDRVLDHPAYPDYDPYPTIKATIHYDIKSGRKVKAEDFYIDGLDFVEMRVYNNYTVLIYEVELTYDDDDITPEKTIENYVENLWYYNGSKEDCFLEDVKEWIDYEFID
jgi:hypothetical protein